MGTVGELKERSSFRADRVEQVARFVVVPNNMLQPTTILLEHDNGRDSERRLGRLQQPALTPSMAATHPVVVVGRQPPATMSPCSKHAYCGRRRDDDRGRDPRHVCPRHTTCPVPSASDDPVSLQKGLLIREFL